MKAKEGRTTTKDSLVESGSIGPEKDVLQSSAIAESVEINREKRPIVLIGILESHLLQSLAIMECLDFDMLEILPQDDFSKVWRGLERLFSDGFQGPIRSERSQSTSKKSGCSNTFHLFP